MHRNKWAFISSTALLSVVILIWLDLFLFGKTMYLPAWTAMLPFSIYTPSYLIFLCLIPVVFLTDTRTNALLFTYKSPPALAAVGITRVCPFSRFRFNWLFLLQYLFQLCVYRVVPRTHPIYLPLRPACGSCFHYFSQKKISVMMVSPRN
jgi:hypothetical protein